MSTKTKGSKKEAGPKSDRDAEPKATGKTPPRLRQSYLDVARPALMKKFNYKNVNQVPRIEKIVVSSTNRDVVTNPKVLDSINDELEMITGQKPKLTRATKSIATFKIREGMPLGSVVTLRNARMFEFLDRLTNVALPRVRDFKGVSPNSFDGRGSYSFGLKEQIIFPEIPYDKVDKIRGMNITIVTTAKTNDEARELLASLGFPFRSGN